MKFRASLGCVVWLVACGGGSPAPKTGGTPDDVHEDAGAGGTGGQVVTPKVDAARDVGSSSPEVARFVEPEGGTAGAPDTGAPDPDAAPPVDVAPALGEFPTDAVKAARFAQLSRLGTHCEGPSLRDGNVFFASDGNGFLRADAAGKVYRYHPRLAPVGSYHLSVDNSLLVCDKAYTVVQVFADGSVAGLLSDADRARINFCNDVTVDAKGNIYFTQARAGDIWRITPEGVLDKVTGGHDYPNGVEIDRESKYLYFSTKSLNRLTIPESGTAFGAPQNVAPGQADGMAFDAWGNLWLAYYGGGGSIRVYDVVRKANIATFSVGGATNLVIGADVVVATGSNRGLFKATVPGVKGFLHPGAPKYAIKKMLDLKPVDDPL